ncbi:phage tail protein [Fructilactobacillus cliffordii]|uniref:phage tail protein n=1 Tax=Fructilactobacillus cliffordii TaxID=2940299 RepID=UPI002092E040|nr:phage tail protein [Fructilactobacillus cliffordii]USS86502.1 phage tail protein [Fructilactobacillus cliffordii]
MNYPQLIVTGIYPNAGLKSQLTMKSVQADSFYVNWEKNGTYQLCFVAIDDGSVSYELLQPNAIITFQGQEFHVANVANDVQNNLATKSITATHVYSETQWFRQREVRSGVLTYTPQSIMDFVFANNPYGFTYEIRGQFDSHQIENFGSVSGLEALNKIVEVWPDAIIFPDNRHIVVYQHDEFVKQHGTVIADNYNATEVKITQDMTAVSNQVWCTGKAKDKAEGAPDNAPTEYFFPPFLVKIQESIDKYTQGIPRELQPIQDDRFTDPESMRQYALIQLVPVPPLTAEVTMIGPFVPIAGDMVHLKMSSENLETDVEIVGYQYYPWSNSQATTLTLNNTAKTIFDYNRAVQSRASDELAKSIVNARTALDQLSLTSAEQQKSLQQIAQHDIRGKKGVALGDSITQGYSPDPHGYGIDYPAKIKDYLGLESETNKGVGGGCFANDDPKLDSATVYNSTNFAEYDFVTIMYSTNDFNISQYGNKITDAMDAMIVKIKHDNPNIRIFGILPTPRHDKSSNGAYSFTDMLNAVSGEYQKLGVPYLDWRNISPDIFQSEGLSSDNIHPNARGYDIIAHHLAAWLKTLY